MADYISYNGRKYHKRAHVDCYDLTFKLLADTPRGPLLDLAAGAGYTSAVLRDMGFAVTATELNTAQFEVPGVELLAVDLNLPFPFADGTFPVVVALEILEHMEAPRRFLAEIARVLTTGGRAIVSTPNITRLASKFRFLFREEFTLFYDTPKRLKDPFCQAAAGHISPLPLWLIRHFLDEAGLRLIRPWYSRETLGLSGNWISTNVVMELVRS